MEVILVKPVRKLGKIGEVLKVRDGFARNWLIPKELAIRATETNKQLIEQQKQALEEKDKAVKGEVEKVNVLLKGKELIFIRQSADDGKLFGSVNNKEIAEILSQLVSYNVLPSNIILDKQLKSIGLFTVEVKLHPELSAFVIVVIARAESEAQNYLKDYKEKSEEVPL